jgi:VanZ family protein
LTASQAAPKLPDTQPRSARTSVATLLYAGFLAYQTLAGGGGWACDERVLRVSTHVSRTDMLANIVAYVPLGFLFVLAAWRQGRRSPGRTAGVLLVATALAGVLSCVLEVVQACLPARISSLYDLGGNLVGALLGAALAVAVRSLASSPPGGPAPADVRRPLRLLTIAIMVMWVASQMTPWVFTLDVSTVYTNIKALRPSFDGFSPTWAVVTHAATSMAVACAWRLAVASPLRSAAGIVTTVALTLALQLLLQTVSPLSASEIVGASLSLVIAVPFVVAAGHRPNHERWARALMLAAATAIVVYEVLPGPERAAAPIAFSWWPLVGLGGMLGAIEYAVLFAWFGVAAVVAQVWATPPGQRPSVAGWPLAAVVLTFVLEALQTRIPGRSGDVSAPLMTLFAVFAARAFLRSTTRP